MWDRGSILVPKYHFCIVISSPQRLKWLLWVSVIYGTEELKTYLDCSHRHPSFPPEIRVAISCSPTFMVSQQLSMLNFSMTQKEKKRGNNTWHVNQWIALKSFPHMASPWVFSANVIRGVEGMLLPVHGNRLGQVRWLTPNFGTSKLQGSDLNPGRTDWESWVCPPWS